VKKKLPLIGEVAAMQQNLIIKKPYDMQLTGDKVS
jgi:hypothetical protein